MRNYNTLGRQDPANRHAVALVRIRHKGNMAKGKGQIGKVLCLFQGSGFQIVEPELDGSLFRADNFLHRIVIACIIR